MSNGNWQLQADDVTGLPLDELALLVLRDAVARGTWNWRNWLLSAKQNYYPRQPDALQALAEAWSWLHTHGLISWSFDQPSDAAFSISRRGHQVLETGLAWLRAVERLDVDLVPALERNARPQFLRGDFETAAFVAMKEVEVQVRAQAGLGDSLLGTKLMQAAFKPGPAAGPLSQPDADPGEAVAVMELFKGAIGLFKNPSSHRRVDFSDPTEAAEIVLLADLLLRLVSKIQSTPADRHDQR
jgi:uncharacterized protein (TIGR02391 family)